MKKFRFAGIRFLRFAGCTSWATLETRRLGLLPSRGSHRSVLPLASSSEIRAYQGAQTVSKFQVRQN